MLYLFFTTLIGVDLAQFCEKFVLKLPFCGKRGIINKFNLEKNTWCFFRSCRSTVLTPIIGDKIIHSIFMESYDDNYARFTKHIMFKRRKPYFVKKKVLAALCSAFLFR